MSFSWGSTSSGWRSSGSVDSPESTDVSLDRHGWKLPAGPCKPSFTIRSTPAPNTPSGLALLAPELTADKLGITAL
jgi:hypothetical protein